MEIAASTVSASPASRAISRDTGATAGPVHARQLAAIATGNHTRQEQAENAPARCLTDAIQLARPTDPSVCQRMGRGLRHDLARRHRPRTDVLASKLRLPRLECVSSATC